MKVLACRGEDREMQPYNHIHANSQTDTPDKTSMIAIFRSMASSILINGVLPLLIYTLMKDVTSVSDFGALLATGIPSLLDSLIGVIRRKRVDFLAGVTLLTILVSLALIALGGSPKLYLICESFFTAAFGLAYLISLLFPKPLAYYFARYFMAGNVPERIAWFESLWQRSAEFRSMLRRIGLLWSFGLLLEAALHTYLVFTLSVQQFLAISPFVLYGITGTLTFLSMLFSIAYGRGVRRRAEEDGLQRETG